MSKRRDRESAIAVSSSLEDVQVHHLPCTIEYDGAARVTAFFQPQPDGEPAVGLSEQAGVAGCSTVSFRGRRLRGVELRCPAGVTGLVLEEQHAGGDDTEDDLIDDSELWETEDSDGAGPAKRQCARRTLNGVARFSSLTYWQREQPPTLDYIPVQWLLEWLPMHTTIHQPVTAEQMQALDINALALE